MQSKKDLLLEHMGYTLDAVKQLMTDRALYRRGEERQRVLETLGEIAKRIELERDLVDHLLQEEEKK